MPNDFPRPRLPALCFKTIGAVCAAFIALLAAGFVSAHAGEIDFENDVAPIFQTHCIDCHGPDEQESRFRIDQRSKLLRGGDSGEPAVVPGDAAASFLLKLVRHEASGKEMPPGERLTDQQIKTIERWIIDGARTPVSYGSADERDELTHWSFRPVTRPTTGDGIDDFIRAKLQNSGLTLSERANRQTRIRRLYLVMLGLPPTPKQVAAFVNDHNEDAWADLVEQVLDSPHYGERWATHWLDLVRFGETHGFETNRERNNAWRYRDWVIDAFNRDKPYDEFVKAQLAGDAFGDDVGTGFLVAGPYDQVKGQDPKLTQVQRMNELDDMINATGTAFLGLTTGCARCHNHKFDPISQRDYYSLQAVFAGVQHSDRTLPLSATAPKQIELLDTKIGELTLKLKPFAPIPQVASVVVDEQTKLRPPVTAKHNVECFAAVPAKFVRFTIEQCSGAEPCIDELEIFAEESNVALASAAAKATSSGDFQHPRHRLIYINDGKYGNSRSWIAQQAANGWVQIELPKVTTIDRIEWSRDREAKYGDRLALKYRIEVAAEPDSWRLVAGSIDRHPFGSPSAAEPGYDFTGHSPDVAAQGRQWEQELIAAKAERESLAAKPVAYAGTFQQPGPTHRLYRGEPDAEREQVAPAAIRAFTSLTLDVDSPEQQRRKALATWIVSKENPLTARVIVNRLWQFQFGTGLVDTPSDFGRNGTRPSHPQLLDWLAADLMQHDWSLKHIHRLILLSETWQQNNFPRADALQIDAASRLLWRFPPRRLEAEAIRDSILAASGVLDLHRAGGPGFSAFDVEAENVRHYHPKEVYGPDDWRRMVYMTKVRQERDHVFGAFDCPDASMVVPKRSRSTTPLQALNLLNSRFVMQQSELLADRLKKHADIETDRVSFAWQLCFQRLPTADEVADSEKFIRQEGLKQFARAMLNANEFMFIP